jgi:hypothetical protein
MLTEVRNGFEEFFLGIFSGETQTTPPVTASCKKFFVWPTDKIRIHIVFEPDGKSAA